jgi:predicted CXXCH cytochrome family protein
MVKKLVLASLLCLLLFPASGMSKQKGINCLECHGDLERGKSVHAALAMGCESCHTAIDATDTPHIKKNKIKRGLSALPPELCFGCHDRLLFNKKVVHAALGKGCSGCHNPHASNAASLLIAPVENLCMTCHDKQLSGKHIMAGYSLGDRHPTKGTTDPAKPSRDLSCVSCHNPHSSSQQKLFVNEASSPASLCLMCHKKISVKTDRP